MKRSIPAVLVCLLAGFALNAVSAEHPGDLAAMFTNPPDAAKPWVYWWWLDSNATKEGITKDLEEMKVQGIGGALIFDAGEGHTSPMGPPFMSPEWLALFKHAVIEADRLGLQLSFNICSGWNAGGTWVTPDIAIKSLTSSQTDLSGPAAISQDLPMPPVAEGYYKDVCVMAYRIASASPELILDGTSAVNVSERMNASGHLAWDAPEGAWRVFRFGQTIHGEEYQKKTKCASRGAQGYEIDFYSREALGKQFAETAGKVLAEAGKLAGRTLKYFHDDSWECGEPNWTPNMRAEFKTRRGYDPEPWLPVLAGQTVQSGELSERFTRDWKRTAADLMAENHYGYFNELSMKSGVGTHPEAGGPFFTTTMDPLMNLGRSDIPMGEYWIRKSEPDGQVWFVEQYGKCDSVKQAATAAHVYGKRLCQAEAFTNMGRNWEEAPIMLKDIGDRALCAGLTRNMLCFYVHQPQLDIKPGYEWPEAGTHFDRNITWWPQMHAFTGYLARCQALLQQGYFVADACYFAGDDAGCFAPAKTRMNPPLPAGFDCDTVNGEVLMTRLAVRDGRLVLPDGMSYRLLVLPERDTMTPESLARIARLVEAGATVVGPKPARSSSLSNYPKCDGDIATLAAKLWGSCDGKTVQENAYGKGRVIWGKTLQEVFEARQIRPDFTCASAAQNVRLDYIHRRIAGVDIYFVANPQDGGVSAECAFRVKERQPEIWDPLSGSRRNAKVFTQREDGTITLPLEFAPKGSVFVIFSKPISPAQNGSAAGNFPAAVPVMDIAGPWTVKFDSKGGGPESVEFADLADWTQRPEDGIKYYSGKATYLKSFDLPESLLPQGGRLFLDLGELNNLAEVRLNGKDLGVLWTKPFRVEITQAARAGNNQLETDIVNLWPNRLIGDGKLPPEKRLTTTNVQKFYTGEHPLLPSGLLGPVRVCREQAE